ncbi:MAG: cob(I)yrinic acid a,c-diamide adenosyltransferase [Clostridiales bacterium]|nr:cob(I)yrinic acid a,c-diamide adenosyltransferase [Clostridiales bacterium]
MQKGYVQVYTGDGKGKTTAALGAGLRAVGRGLRVMMVQFLKGRHTGELEALKRLAPEFQILRFAETKKFFNEMDQGEIEELKAILMEEMENLNDLLKESPYDVLILDEIMGAMQNGLISEEEVSDIIKNKAPNMELILTGRNLPEAIARQADLITEMKNIKHYSDKGVAARVGIEM